LEEAFDKEGNSKEIRVGKLKIIYHDEEGAQLSESFDFTKPGKCRRLMRFLPSAFVFV